MVSRKQIPAGESKNRHSGKGLKVVLIVPGSLLVATLIAIVAFLYQPKYAIDPAARLFIEQQITQQEKIIADLRQYYRAGKFTFENPMVIQNPYQTAPLTALVVFDTPEESQVSIHVPGKIYQADVNYTFPGFRRHHEIPALGLYADTLNRVTLSLVTESGRMQEKVIELQTEPLPVYMQSFRVDTVTVEKYSPGFNFAYSSAKPVFDINGEVRWFSTRPSFLFAFTRLTNGHFLFAYMLKDQDNNPVMEEDLLGKIYRVYHFSNKIHHDIYELPSGNLLATSSDLKSGTIDDIIDEVDRDTGHILRSLDLKKVLDPNRRQFIGHQPNDWFHLNSFVYDPTDRSIIISGRGQSAVVKLSYPDMRIQWILGPHDNWSEKYQPYLLTPVGEGFEWPWAQHHATLYSPDIPGDGMVDILLFDNGQYRSFDLATATSPLEWYSRVVHYQVNEEKMTVEQVWEYGKERGSSLFTGSYGSAYLLSNGNVLGTWGAIARNPEGIPVLVAKQNDTEEAHIIEIDPGTDQVVYEATAKDYETYRCFRGGLYDGFTEENSSMRANLRDTSGNDLYDRIQIAWKDVKLWSQEVPQLVWLKRIVRRLIDFLH